ncbi:MAG TPA: thiol reductant ABC exporter subunit CydD, partial [Candidatus Avamphibacillus intestinigallinarum]|nr:thiol reductant ABC exporter subunit CydD [Candidatus Avamphibacillus intestinigallinarum]
MTQKRMRKLPQYPGSSQLHVLLILLTIVEVIAILGQSYFLAKAVTSLFFGAQIAIVVPSIGLFLLSYLLRHVFSYIQEYLAERYARQTAQTLRVRLLQTYFQRQSSLAQQKGTGHLVTLLTEGTDKIKKYLEIIGMRMIHTTIIPIVIVIYVWTIDHTSAILLIVTVPVTILFMILLGKAAQAKADRQYVTYQRLSNHFVDSLKGLETLMYLGKSKAHAKKIDRVNTDYKKATMKTLRVAFLSSFALDFFTSLSIAFVAVGLGLRLVEGTFDLLPALTILLLAPEYFSPIKQVGKDYHATLDGQLAMSEIEGILHEDDEATYMMPEADFKLDQNKLANADFVLKDISITIDNRSILDDMSLTLPSGWTGIIGASGSGKTTLINLLAGRIHPSTGQVLLGQNGPSLLESEDWYKHIAYIPQEPYIFPLSIADNCRFYAPDASDEDIKDIIEMIGLDAVVRKLPQGIHEPIGEGGRTLSGGQAQRIAIARVLLSRKQVILLDEPTVHLDIETEYEIKQIMKRVFANKRVIFATHRLHWVHD